MRGLFISLFVAATVMAGAPPTTFTGAIIDAECAGGGHARMRMGDTDAECARACADSHGAVYVLDDGADVYYLSDQKTAERLAGQKVAVVGTLDPKTRRIEVESITAAPPKSPA